MKQVYDIIQRMLTCKFLQMLISMFCNCDKCNFCSFYPLPFFYRSFLTIPEHKVAVLREEGTNGDREMAAALYMAGLEVWDIHMQDLLDSKIDLDIFRGLIFPGGFSYAGFVNFYYF